MVSYLKELGSEMSLLVSLNPCCSGRWSRTANEVFVRLNANKVLILVVVEDGLVRIKAIQKFK